MWTQGGLGPHSYYSTNKIKKQGFKILRCRNLARLSRKFALVPT